MIARAIFAATLLFSPMAVAQTAKPSVVTTAMTAPDDRARQWLTLVDDGNYSQSWNQAGAAFKSHISPDVWAKQGPALREPLGALVSRDLQQVDLSRPQTAVVRYDSSFAHKTGATETITLTMDKSGWSVTGYTVK